MIKSNNIQMSFLLFSIMMISSCAPNGSTPDAYGFFSGLWHGFCLPYALIGKLFGLNIGLYAAHNSGLGYWFGFTLALGAVARAVAEEIDNLNYRLVFSVVFVIVCLIMGYGKFAAMEEQWSNIKLMIVTLCIHVLYPAIKDLEKGNEVVEEPVNESKNA